MADTAENVKDLDASKDNSSSSITEISPNVEVTSEGKNLHQIKCQRCPSTILVSGTATLVTNEFVLPESHLKEVTQEPSNSLNKYWCVDNMYAFENVGFSKTVDGVKYLICADCEIGPIGWHDLNTKLSYVSLCKTSYC